MEETVEEDAQMSRCIHTQDIESNNGVDGLGNADYVWWMRIMWRLHSSSVRGLYDNSGIGHTAFCAT